MDEYKAMFEELGEFTEKYPDEIATIGFVTIGVVVSIISLAATHKFLVSAAKKGIVLAFR